MARETRSATIDGFTFTVQQLPAMRAIKLMHKLTRAAGPALLKAVGGAAGGVKLSNLNLADMADGAQTLFDKFSEDDLEALIKTLFEGAVLGVDGKEYPLSPGVLDIQLSGKPGTILKAVRFALEANYADFFGEFLAGVAVLKASPSKESTT